MLRDQRSNADLAHTVEPDLYRHFVHGLPLAFGIELMVQRRGQLADDGNIKITGRDLRWASAARPMMQTRR